MQREAQQEVSIEALRKFVAKWGAVLTLAGAGFGVFWEHRQGIKDLKSALGKLREDCDKHHARCDAIHSFGPGGFTDPQIRAGLDASIREFLRANNAELELQRRLWRQALFDLNPQLKRPSE